MKYIATTNELPEEEVEFDSADMAWAYHTSCRQAMEEESYPGANYTQAVLALAQLAGQTFINGGNQHPIGLHEAHDGQVIGYAITTEYGQDPTGWVKVRTRLPGDEDYDTDPGEVLTVRESK